MSDDSGGEIESAIRAVLPANAVPWNVTAYRDADGTWVVELTHEASNGLVFETRDADATIALAHAIHIIESDEVWRIEVERISRAPKIEHPDTVAGIRTLAQMFGWSRTEVRAVVGLLREVDALDDDEAGWLDSSFGDDRPPPRATGIM